MKIMRVLIACLVALGIFSSAPNRIVRSNIIQSSDPVENLMSQTGGKVVIGRDHETGLVEFIGTDLTAPIQSSGFLAETAAPAQAAMQFAGEYGVLFGLEDPSAELSLETVTQEKYGASFVRYQQVYQGIPVLGGELVVQLDGMKRLLSLSGKVLPKINLATSPGIAAADARQMAFTLVAKEYKIALDQLEAALPSLWIYQPAMMGGKGVETASLVWRVEVATQELQPVNELVLIDAQKGGIRLNFNQIETALYRKIYDNNNNYNLGLPGNLARVEGQGNSSIVDVNDVYTYAGDTYNFYKNNFGRDSIDGKGMQLVSTTRYCSPLEPEKCPFPNSFWNGVQTVYGEGFASADDVVGHEITHGVTSYTSKLFYYMQPGAINEGLSDIMGEFIDLTNGHGITDTPEVRWIMGEDLPQGAAIRNMKDPSLSSLPSADRMTSLLYACGDYFDTDVEVHRNSAVLSKAAYLIAEGDGSIFNGQTITGIGIAKALQIFYYLEANLLSSGSDYEDVYNLLPQACRSQVGRNGISQGDCDQVTKAVTATEMNQQPTSCPALEAPLACPNNWRPFIKWFDGLENGAGNWNFIKSNVDPYPRWQLNSPYSQFNFPYRGSNYLYGDDYPPAAVDASAEMKNGVSLTTGMGDYYFLHFTHLFDIPYRYTGGIVEYELNGNNDWLPMDALPVVNGPDVIISSFSGNPLGEMTAFSGYSSGYMSTRYDLSSLHGNTIRFRFRLGLDPDVSQVGWFIDNVNIYQCLDPALMIYKGFFPALYR